jgi:protein-tyrosine phosphatase
MAAPFSILHVCMGNICRSPMAERLLVKAARDAVGEAADRLLLVGSTGTGGWHAGSGMQPAAARQVLRRGGQPDGFRCRQLAREHLEAADLILTATAEQYGFVVELSAEAADRTFVLGEFGRLLGGVERSKLPTGGDPDSVYERGVALVDAVATARGGRPPRPGDDLDDPYGRSDAYYARIADEIERTVRPLVAALLPGRHASSRRAGTGG